MKLFRRIALTGGLLAALGVPGMAEARYSLITLLHTNDLHGRVIPIGEKGGLARAATLIRQIRADMPNVITLDAGDMFVEAPEDYFSGGLATITAMNAAGYCAATVGNHEFDFGEPSLQKNIAAGQFPFLAANLHKVSGEQWDKVAPYVILNADGVRIAVLGLTTLEVISLHWPGSISDIRVDDPIQTAQTLLPQLKSQADVVVVLSHLGYELDKSLAAKVQGIDFIIGAHSHTVIDNWQCVGNTLITQTGAYGHNLGRIDFIVRASDSASKIVSVNGKNGAWCDLPKPPLGKAYPRKPLIPVDDKIAIDDAVQAAYLPFRTESDTRLAEVLGQAPSSIPGQAAGAVESSAGNLLADALRYVTKSDIGIVDIKGLGNRGIAPGPVTLKSVFDLISGYTRQEVVTGRTPGKQLIASLQMALASGSVVRLGISGGSYEYKLINSKPTITKLLVNGEPIDPEREYTISAQSYMMMYMMPCVQPIAEPTMTTREALRDYIKAQVTIQPPVLGRAAKQAELAAALKPLKRKGTK